MILLAHFAGHPGALPVVLLFLLLSAALLALLAQKEGK